MDLINTGNAASVEIVRVIEDSGLRPDRDQLNQLSQAMLRFIEQNSLS